MNGVEELKLTVQGIGSPVPATFESDQAGSLSSRSSYCNVVSVEVLAESTDITTSESECITPTDPLKKSGMVNRSPAQKSKNWPLPMLKMSNRVRSESSLNLSSPIKETKVDPWMRMGTRIEELLAFSKTRANIQNMEVKKLILGISSDYEAVKRLKDLKENGPSKCPLQRKSTGTQTSLVTTSQPTEMEMEATTSATSQLLVVSNKRKLSSPINGESSKRKSRVGKADNQNSTATKNEPQIKPNLRDHKQALQLKSTNDQNLSQMPLKNKDRLDEEWKMVKRKPRKKRQKPPRPDAVLIRKVGTESYADMLKKLKSESDLKQLGEEVTRIRKTANGDLLLELQNTEDKNRASNFQQKIEQVLGTNAEVKALTSETHLEIKDIDEVTTQEEIAQAIEESFKVAIEAANVKLRKAYGDTQTAVLRISSATAQNMIDVGKIRIGWVICRIRAKINLIKCFKCHDFGHLAGKCKSIDRSKLCFKCGEDDHKAKTCSSAAKCMLCIAAGKMNYSHVAGSVNCPAFLIAIQNVRR